MAKVPHADIRGHLDRILEHARQDPAFGDRLRADPTAVLTEERLHEDAVDEVSQEIAFAHHPVADARCRVTCDYTTCWVSSCDMWTTYGTNN